MNGSPNVSPFKRIYRAVPITTETQGANTPEVNNAYSCCKSNCFDLLPDGYAEGRIQFLKTLSTEERCVYIYRELRLHYEDGELRPKGVQLCQKTQRQLCCINQNELYRIKKLAREKLAYSSTARQLRDSSEPVTEIQKRFVAVMGAIERDLGETMPHQTVTNPNKEQERSKHPQVLITNAIYSNKKELYEDVISQLPPLSYDYFRVLWGRYLWWVQLKKWNPFAKCDACVNIRYCILNAESEEERQQLLVRQREHRELVSYLRRRASARQNLANDHPNAFLSIYMDGMDSKKTQVPRLRSDAAFSKDLDNTGSTFDTRLIGMHVPGVGFYGWWAYPLFKQGGDGTCTLLLRLFNELLAKTGRLPRVLLLMLDNTCKENKNNQVISYLAYLVHEGVFDSVQITFLLVGHTHCIIDQRFSVIHRELATKDGFTLPHVMQAVQGLKLKDSNTGATFNQQQEIQQALDYSWLKRYAYHFKGLSTTKIEGEKHTAHAILLSKLDGTVVFQYKDQDVPGEWQGHYFNNSPLPVFHTPPVAPQQLLALPRVRVDLADVKVKVDAMYKFCGISDDTPSTETAHGSSAAATAFREKKLNTRLWWAEVMTREISFWQDKGNSVSADQEVTDPKLASWLPRLPNSSHNWSQPMNTPAAQAAAAQAVQLLKVSNLGGVDANLVYPAVRRWIGRPKVPGDLPNTLHFFNPTRDVTPATIVIMLVDKEASTMGRGWELAIVSAVRELDSGIVFNGDYLRPELPAIGRSMRRGRGTGAEAENWPQDWEKLPLVQYLTPSRRGWDFAGVAVDVVVWGTQATTRKGSPSVWGVRPKERPVLLAQIAEAERASERLASLSAASRVASAAELAARREAAGACRACAPDGIMFSDSDSEDGADGDVACGCGSESD